MIDISGDIFALTLITLLVVLILVIVWQGFATYRARASIAREEAYQKLAEQAVSTQQTLTEERQHIAEDLKALRDRVSAIEKLLREVG